jgi:tRNA(Ile)-lysidine synthase
MSGCKAMAASPTPKPTRASAQPNPALAPLQGLETALPVAVAFSGGADSTALLLAAAQVWPGDVRAIHIHHGLQAAADGFAQHCETLCRSLDIPLRQTGVDAKNRPGESPEDAARKARYTALAQAAHELQVRSVLVAQHADDQVETVLLALSRGAGLPGLAAMPARFERHGMLFQRPLLGVSGAALRKWLAHSDVTYIEDPTNADVAFTRNRIRRELLPALEKSFPAFRDTFARSAQHAAQAQELLDALAADDLISIGMPPRVSALRELPRSRQANVLRHWLRVHHESAASAAQLEELLAQVAACATRGHRISLKIGAGRVELREGALHHDRAGVGGGAG